MRRFQTVLLLLLIGAGLAGGGYYVGTQKDKTDDKQAPAKTTVVTEKPQTTNKKIDLPTIMANLQKKFPTVQQTYIYTEQRDPNGNLGKAGYYVAGAEFYDTGTNTAPDGEAFGADSGGAIEVYASTADAIKRVDYLKQFQGDAALDPGAFKQVGVNVIRASSKYTKSQQDEVINYLTTQLQ